jgi:predicted DNA-binding transcriptional regulator YafY
VPRVWQVEVWLDATLEELQRRTGFPRALFAADGAGATMRVDVEDLPWMARFLAGLGVRVIVRHPAELRTVLREYALALLSDAERTDTHSAS